MAKGQSFRLLTLLNKKWVFLELLAFTPDSFHAPCIHSKVLYWGGGEEIHEIYLEL